MKFNIVIYLILTSYSFAFYRNNIYSYKRLSLQKAIAIFGTDTSLGKVSLEKCVDEFQQVITLVDSNYTDFDISEQIICYKGDISKYNDVKQIYKNHNITGTIINLNDVSSKKNLLKGTKNIIKCIKKNSSKKIVLTSAIGCGSSINKIPFYLKFLIKTVLKKQYNDKNYQEQLFLSGSGKSLEYVILRHGTLTNDLQSSIAIINNGYDEISREDVAAICYDAITLNNFPFIRKVISIVTMKKKYSSSKEYISNIHWSNNARNRFSK